MLAVTSDSIDHATLLGIWSAKQIEPSALKIIIL